jgi:integrase
MVCLPCRPALAKLLPIIYFIGSYLEEWGTEMSTEIARRADSATVRVSDALLSAEQLEGIRELMAAARADNTNKAYQGAWDRFAAWCRENGHTALPADPVTIAAWMRDMGKSLSRASINQYLSAIVLRHRTKGYALDRKAPEIAETWKGLSRRKARTEVNRKAKPLMGDDLRELVRSLRKDRPADVRDAALLVLGWAGALRRSELVGLDWLELGKGARAGAGYIALEDRGLVVTLATSKGSQANAEKIVIPCPDMPTACDALALWSRTAKLKRGEPVFRPIANSGNVLDGRLTDRSVSLIIKARIAAYYRSKGKSPAEAEALAAGFSGHSMRAGYATTAGEHDEPGYRIQRRMRHKSMDTTTGYIRAAEQWTKSGLKGFGW